MPFQPDPEGRHPALTAAASSAGHHPMPCAGADPGEAMRALLRSGCLEMHYQPILDLRTSAVTKVEALARLRHGDTLLAPDCFLPHFRDAELLELYALGLDQALAQRRHWLEQGIALDLSVNLPPSALTDARYFDITIQALARHGCPPQRLTLEILEHAAVSPEPGTSRLLRQFKDLGVCLAEDDLGAGHSSLRRLRELPFDWIKIDRHIVRLLDSDNWEVLHFIYQLTRLGHSLCKAVVVEGVETADLIEAVQILGVDAAQGYGIARPMAGAQLADWIGGAVARPRGEPATLLGRLARLLIVEERLHLTQSDQERRDLACDRVCDIAPALAGPARSAEASCLDCQLDRFRVDLDRIFPGDTSCRAEKDALLHAASRHGLASHHYRQARRRLATGA